MSISGDGPGSATVPRAPSPLPVVAPERTDTARSRRALDAAASAASSGVDCAATLRCALSSRVSRGVGGGTGATETERVRDDGGGDAPRWCTWGDRAGDSLGDAGGEMTRRLDRGDDGDRGRWCALGGDDDKATPSPLVVCVSVCVCAGVSRNLCDCCCDDATALRMNGMTASLGCTLGGRSSDGIFVGDVARDTPLSSSLLLVNEKGGGRGRDGLGDTALRDGVVGGRSPARMPRAVAVARAARAASVGASWPTPGGSGGGAPAM